MALARLLPLSGMTRHEQGRKWGEVGGRFKPTEWQGREWAFAGPWRDAGAWR